MMNMVIVLIKWWTDSSIQNFKELTQCFVNQYDQYTLQGFRVGGRLIYSVTTSIHWHCTCIDQWSAHTG